MYVLYNARRGYTFHSPYCSNTCMEESVTRVLVYNEYREVSIKILTIVFKVGELLKTLHLNESLLNSDLFEG